MKNIIQCCVSIVLLFFFLSCTSQSQLSEETVDRLVNSEQFTFLGEKAHPMGGDITNVLVNMRSSGILDLTHGDGIVFKESIAQVHLPYFGRVYNPSYDNTRSAFIFESKEFDFDKVKNEKGVWIVRFSPKDQHHIRHMQLEIFKNGTASLNVDANDRQSISYSGRIAENTAATK